MTFPHPYWVEYFLEELEESVIEWQRQDFITDNQEYLIRLYDDILRFEEGDPPPQIDELKPDTVNPEILMKAVLDFIESVRVEPSKLEPLRKPDFALLRADTVLPSINNLEPYKSGLKPPEIASMKEIVFEPKYPVRQKRKQWAGKPTIRTHEPDFHKLKVYPSRSMLGKMRALPIEPIQARDRLETLKRSLAHRPLKVPIGVIVSQEIVNDRALFQGYKRFAYKLMREAQHTAAMVDAWEEYIPEGLLEDFIADTFEPTVRAFIELPDLIKDFIADAWEKYAEEAFKARQARYGMNLTEDDVAEIPDADKSILDAEFSIEIGDQHD